MNNEYSLVHVFSILKKWRKRILISTILAGVLAILFSLFMDNYYKSTALAYPANEDLAKPIPLGSFERNSDYYGAKNELDRLLTTATSTDYILKIIDTFDLYKHYEINRDKARAEFQILMAFSSLYEAKKTKYGALEISMEDKEPDMAKNIVKYAIELLDSEAQKYVKNNQNIQSEALKHTIAEKELRNKVLNDSLANLRDKYGVLNTERQGEVLSEILSNIRANLNEAEAKYQYYKTKGISRDSTYKYDAARAGFKDKLEVIEKDVFKFNQGFSKITSIEKQLKILQDQLAFDSERLNQMNTAINSRFPSILLVQEPTTPNVKSRPKRMFIVLGVVMFAFFFSCFAALVLESYKSFIK